MAAEYWRQSTNSRKREAQQDTSLVRLKQDVSKLKTMVNEQKDDLAELIRLVEVLENKQFHPVKPK